MQKPFFLAALFLAACSATGTGFSSDDDGGVTGDGAAGNLGGGDSGPVLGHGDSGGEVQGTVLLYAHTDTTLYSFDPSNIGSAPTKIGTFDCISTGNAMTDIAIAKDGKLYGVSNTAAYPLTIQGSTVHCDATWPLPTSTTVHFYGLTMAPENTVAATEVLIAANGAGELYQIDATTGNTTQVGTLGKDSHNNAWKLSGDIVFLANSGSPIGFATVRTCSSSSTSSCTSTDTLIEVDVSAVHPGTQSALASVRGQIVKGSSCSGSGSATGFGSTYGIAAYADKVYGFTRSGDVVEIDNGNGSACLIASYPSDKFAGAGVTTTAPVIAPPK